jgi:hypothetical protein
MVMTDTAGGHGHDSGLCGARRRQGEGTCKRPAGWGTPSPGAGCCKLHGGSTSSQRQAASQELVRREIAQAVDILNAAPVDNPLRALAALAGQVLAWKDAIAARVDMARLLDEDSGQVRGEVVLLERALDRANVVLATIGRLNLDERLAAIDEAAARAVVEALHAGLAHIGVTGGQAEQALQATRAHLRLVSTEGN